MSDEVLERVKMRMAQEIPQIAMPSLSPQPVPAVSSKGSQPSPFSISVGKRKPMPLRSRQMPQMGQMRQFPLRRMPLLSQPTKIAAPQPRTQPEQPSLESISKLKPFLQDPAVMSIECSGEGKSLTLNRSGITHSVQLSLTKEEIDSILNEFSAKTKIPLVQGVFKAIYSGLLMTAVVSDNIGSRFIIEKQFAPPKLPTQEKNK